MSQKRLDGPLKGLPVNRALNLCQEISTEAGLPVNQYRIFELMTNSIPVYWTKYGTSYIDSNAFRLFLDNFHQAVRREDSSLLRQRRGLCVENVVGIEEFCESKEYMNQGGYLRPAIKRKMLELFEDYGKYIEAVLTGAIGIGKNYFADLASAYMIYRLSVYHNPQMEFDLAPGSSIIFIMQSKSYKLAKKVVFDQFAERLRLSPYFREYFPFDPGVKSELRFRKNIFMLPVGGDDTASIGMNVFGGVVDEMNFMARTVNSAKIAFSGEAEYDQAERLYRSLIQRMKSRFIQNDGKVPGKLFLISSSNYPGDFTDRKIKEAEKDKTIFVMKYAIWEALPADRLSDKMFPVEIGNEYKRSRILTSVDEAKNEGDVIWVPMNYYSDFERDIEMALRELGGIATGSKHPFIPQRELIESAQVKFSQATENKQLFKHDSCVISEVVGDPSMPDWDQLIDYSYIENVIFDPAVVFACHIDVGLTQDAAGVGVGRISGYKLLPIAKVFDEKNNDFIEIRDIRVPEYTLDGILQVKAPLSGEVDLELLRDLILHLRSFINVRWATMDSYQSAMMIQGFRRAMMRSGVLSVDTSIAPYAELKQSIKDERLLIPRHYVLAKELRELERDPEKDKIDHPSGGSKDCSDAAAGVVYMLQRKEAKYGKTSRRVAGKTRASASGRGRDGRKIRLGGRSRRGGSI